MREALEQEARVLAGLPPGIPAPALVGSAAVGEWRVLVLAVIDGHQPGQPWTPAEVEAVRGACTAIAGLATPAPAGLAPRSVVEDIGGDERVVAVGAALAAGRFDVPGGMPSWPLRRQREVGALVLAAGGRLGGETLTHGDLRPDNILVDAAGTAWVLDWNWVRRGPAWMDLVGLLPMMWWHGIDTGSLVRDCVLTRDADPEAVDSFLACIVAYMVSALDRPPPPGCTPALREHQRLMAHLFLGFLGARRGWARKR